MWLDEARKLALKIPNPIGKLWQKMDADHAERDLSVLREYDIPIVPTRIHKEACALMADNTRQQVEMVLEQPLLNPSHPIAYRELMHCQKVRDFIIEMLRKGEAIYQEKDLGLDLLGGKAFLLPFVALNPFQRKMNAEVSNFLVADGAIQTPDAWIQDDRRKRDLYSHSLYNRRRGNTIAEAGDIRLCDVRLFDFDRKGCFDRGMAYTLRQLREVQFAALWSILETLGIKPEIDFETRVQRLARALVLRATPKMRAYAEATAGG